MNKKYIFVAGLVVLLLLVGGALFVFLDKEGAGSPSALSPEEIVQADVDDSSGLGASVFENIEKTEDLPETNPFAGVETNPFKDGYKNPFE